MPVNLQLPQTYQENLTRAIEILQQGGCTEVYLFGSLASGKFHQQSDIDLAVRGCPSGNFFALLGKLLITLDYSVDLVDLDKNIAFAHFLEREKELQRIA
jgi:predicted nucleotidyltransferase